MPLYPTVPSNSVSIIPPDTYQAVCFAVIDVGTHVNKAFDNKYQRQVVIGWEIVAPDAKPDEKRKTIFKIYTNSCNPKSTLYKDLVSWRGANFKDDELSKFDLFRVISANCLLQIINVTRNNRTYNNIASIMKLPATAKVALPQNPIIKYSIEENGFNWPQTLPGWIKEHIKKSEEYKAIENELK